MMTLKSLRNASVPEALRFALGTMSIFAKIIHGALKGNESLGGLNSCRVKLVLVCAFLWCACVGIALGSDGSELLPAQLKSIKTLYTALPLAIGLPNFSGSSHNPTIFHRNPVYDFVYKPVQKISLTKPLSSYLERRTKKERGVLGPLGYFIAYAPDASVWLLEIDWEFDWVTVFRLRPATDPKVLKIYWRDLEEPQVESQSRFLFNLIVKHGPTYGTPSMINQVIEYRDSTKQKKRTSQP